MKRSAKHCLSLIGLLASAAALSSFASAQAPLAPISFTSAQVAGGRANYAAKCARCHGSELEGGAGPALSGGGLDNYLGGSAGDLAAFLNASMPQDMPGTLTPDETATLIALLAEKNGRTAGSRPLPSDKSELAKIGFAQ